MGNRRAIVLLSMFLLAAPRLADAEPGAQVIAYGDAGLRVGETTLVKGKIDYAAYDAEQDLVWFTSKRNLSVLDLRAKKLKAVVIAKKMPEMGFAIEGSSKADTGNDYTGFYPILVAGKKPKIKPGEGVYSGIFVDQDNIAKKAIKKIKIVGGKWLKAQAKRLRQDAPYGVSEAAVGTVTLPADMGACEDETMCGEARSFGKSGLQLVLVEHSCGDACHTSCVLHDPTTKKFASPTESTGWGAQATGDACWGYHFAPDQKTYVLGGTLCTLGKSVVCSTTEDWRYIGWLTDDVAASVGLVAGATGSGTGSGTGTVSTGNNAAAAQALVELTALRDSACKCKDKTCTAKVQISFDAWMVKHQSTQGSDEQTAAAAKVAEAMMVCIMKF